MKWTITAYVRRRGDIGVFQSRAFEVEAPATADRVALRDAWFAAYADDWELAFIEAFAHKVEA